MSKNNINSILNRSIDTSYYDKTKDDITLKFDNIIEKLYFKKELSNDEINALNKTIDEAIISINEALSKLNNEELKLFKKNNYLTIAGYLSIFMSIGINPNFIAITLLTIIESDLELKKLKKLNEIDNFYELRKKAIEYKEILNKKKVKRKIKEKYYGI